MSAPTTDRSASPAAKYLSASRVPLFHRSLGSLPLTSAVHKERTNAPHFPPSLCSPQHILLPVLRPYLDALPATELHHAPLLELEVLTLLLRFCPSSGSHRARHHRRHRRVTMV